MSNNSQFLGIVENKKFKLVFPKSGPDIYVRLTSIPMQAAQSPESAELDLSTYQGKAIMVRGHDGGGWIYSAEVIDEAGPILTVVVQQLFKQQ